MALVMADSSDNRIKMSTVTERYHRLVNRMLSVNLVRRTQMDQWKFEIKRMKCLLLEQLQNDVSADG